MNDDDRLHVQDARRQVRAAMEEVFDRAHQVCCGRGGESCCGDPDMEFDGVDHDILETLDACYKLLGELLQ